MDFPQGIITLVFTDIEGSSAMWEEHGAAFAPVLDEHNRLMRAAAAHHGGFEVKTEGDAFFLVFARAEQAVAFALEAQLALVACDWSAILAPVHAIRVRMGLHSGEPIFARHPDGQADYFGPVVNRAARVGGAGHGGQIVLSEGVRQAALEAASQATWQWENLGRHRLKGVGEETLSQVWTAGLPERFPPLKTMAGARHNLPAVVSTFVGRRAELAEAAELLASPNFRLLTLLAFGGQGKTRLALQLAEQMVEAGTYGDGVWWIELEEARDEEAMRSRIAHELRLLVQPQVPLKAQLQEFLRDRQILLVLDNTEQIARAGAVVAELLAAGAGVRCLVTTRRALEIKGEQIVRVPPLCRADAVELFALRAAARSGVMEASADDDEAIAELCRQLEYVPLAIELAASRSGVLSPAEMLTRLDERFRLLQTRSPDMPPRQRALRGAIDWSYELLEPEERELLAELSIFAGGFALEAAEKVAQGDFVLEGVEELLRHSLLRPDSEGGGAKRRFSMPESVRAYATEKLEEAGRAGTVLLRHSAYFEKLAQLLCGELHSAREAAALETASAERANLQKAFSSLLQSGDHPRALALGCALFDLLHPLGFWNEAEGLLQATEEAGLLQSPSQEAMALRVRLASLEHDRGTERALERVADLLERDDAPELALPTRRMAHNLRGLLALDERDYPLAEKQFAVALQLSGTSTDATSLHGRAVSLHNLALVAARQGEPERAAGLYQQALEARRAGGDGRGEAETEGNLGVLAQNAGDLEGAAALYRHSLELRRKLQDRFGMAFMLYNLGEVASLKAQYEPAVVLFHHAAALFRELGSGYAGTALEAEAGAREQLLLAGGQVPLGTESWEQYVS